MNKYEAQATFNGKYKVVKELGDGMSSTVYLCEEATSGNQVAIKIFKESYLQSKSDAKIRE